MKIRSEERFSDLWMNRWHRSVTPVCVCGLSDVCLCVCHQGTLSPVTEAVQRGRQRLRRGSDDRQLQHQGSLQEGPGSQGAQGEWMKHHKPWLVDPYFSCILISIKGTGGTEICNLWKRILNQWLQLDLESVNVWKLNLPANFLMAPLLRAAGHQSLRGRPERAPQSGTKEHGCPEAAAGGAEEVMTAVRSIQERDDNESRWKRLTRPKDPRLSQWSERELGLRRSSGLWEPSVCFSLASSHWVFMVIQKSWNDVKLLPSPFVSVRPEEQLLNTKPPNRRVCCWFSRLMFPWSVRKSGKNVNFFQ